ncbi:MAG: hypothetical protein AAB229_02180 [Candidatus Hydrogenedentota bacterium]
MLCFMMLVFSALAVSMSTSVVSGNIVQTDRKDEDSARRYALAAREMILRRARADDEASGSGSWRARAQAGAYNISDSPIGYGILSTNLKDPGGNFTDRSWETAVLSCTGVAGRAVYSFTEIVSPAPAEATKHVLFSAEDISVDAYTLSHGSAFANRNIKGNKTFNGDGYASGAITAKVLGESLAGVDEIQVPSGDSSWYMAVGTVIPYQSEYKNMLFSPTSNPFGAANPFGVYIISPATGDVTINNCRIVGTLVYAKAKDRKVSFKGGILMEAASPVQLVLLVMGDKPKIEFNGKNELNEAMKPINFNPPGTPYPYNEQLSEVLTPLQNFNPPGTPDPNFGVGVSNGNMTDKFQSHINGYIWCNGEIKARNSLLRLRGGLGCGKKLSVRGYVGWNSMRQFLPLMGMEGYGLVLFPGTFRKMI